MEFELGGTKRKDLIAQRLHRVKGSVSALDTVWRCAPVLFVHSKNKKFKLTYRLIGEKENNMLNHIDIMGRLVGDPELRSTSSNIKVASFRIACDREVYGKDKEKETDFIDCVAWRQKGEFICRNFHKGDMIVLSGRLQIRPWEDRDGNKRYATEIIVNDVYFGGSKKKAVDASSEEQDAVFKEIDGDDDDLPFAIDDEEALPL